MKNLVRGGVILSLIGTFVMFIFAQTQTETALSIAKDSQTKLRAEIRLVDNFKKTQSVQPQATLEAVPAVTGVNDPEGKKLVKKTVLTKAAAGRSRGSFTATAYCLRGRTATGQGVRRGIIAADPRVLKLGSTVSLNAGGYSGNYVVSDTGGRIKGNKIDIWVASCAEARKFGRRTVSISQ